MRKNIHKVKKTKKTIHLCAKYVMPAKRWKRYRNVLATATAHVIIYFMQMQRSPHSLAVGTTHNNFVLQFRAFHPVCLAACTLKFGISKLITMKMAIKPQQRMGVIACLRFTILLHYYILCGCLMPCDDV